MHFGTVHICSHAIILGDNPATSEGPPVTIEWTAFDTVVLNVDDYEQTKAKGVGGARPRKGPEMIIPLHLRIDMLKAAGYARSEMDAVVREINKIRQNRARTASAYAALNRLPWLAKRRRT